MTYNNPSALAQNFKKIAEKALGIATAQLVHPGRFKVKVPEGYTYENFNSVGQPTVWSTIRHFEVARLLGFWKNPLKNEPSFMDIGSHNQMLYIVSLKLSCEPDLYNLDVKKQPVDIDNELVYVGNTSFKIRSNLFVSQLKERMVQQDISLVMVDKETRRPSLLPTWWVEKYTHYSLPNEGPIKAKYLDFSNWTGKINEHGFIVRSMDLDAYFHVNNMCFIRYCYEAYIFHYVRQFGYANQADAFRNIKDLICAFRGEAGLGDLLKVSFVVDSGDEDTCHFQITNDSRIIFQCLFKFFPQRKKKLSHL